MTEWTSKLLIGISELLATRYVGTWSASSVAPIGGDDVGVFIGTLPPKPDMAVGLVAYRVAQRPDLTDSTIGVQVRVRGNAAATSLFDLSDRVASALNGYGPGTLGTSPNDVYICSIRYMSGAPLGEDSNGRQEQTMNFYVTANVPGTETG